MRNALVVMSGAALGGLARYLVATAIMTRLGERFPWGTLAVNISGCFLIGLIAGTLAQRTPSPWSLFLVTGVLGGYTTFSAFGWETVQLSRQGAHGLALTNILASVLAGYLAVWLGVILARR
jgi:fluoride exporter